MSSSGFFDPLEPAAYGAIAIDPPWKFASNSEAKPGRNPRRHYPCMTMAEIAALPVGDLAARDCWLMMWITAPLLVLGVQTPILKAWGFKPSTIGFTWVKLNKGMTRSFLPFDDDAAFVSTGFTTRANVEYVVLARRGKPPRASASVRSLILAERREHSRKPDVFYDRACELVGKVRKAEIFARESRPGWETWGNEATKFDSPAALAVPGPP